MHISNAHRPEKPVLRPERGDGIQVSGFPCRVEAEHDSDREGKRGRKCEHIPDNDERQMLEARYDAGAGD